MPVLRMTSRSTRSSCSTATRSPIGPPQSWTTSVRSLQVELLDEARDRRRRGGRTSTSRSSSGLSERPKPIRSGATTRPGSCGMILRQRNDEVGSPCRSRIGSPCPRRRSASAGRRGRASGGRRGSPGGSRCPYLRAVRSAHVGSGVRAAAREAAHLERRAGLGSLRRRRARRVRRARPADDGRRARALGPGRRRHARRVVRELLWERRRAREGQHDQGDAAPASGGRARALEVAAAARAIAGARRAWLDWQGLTLAEAEGLRESVLAALGDGEPRTRAGDRRRGRRTASASTSRPTRGGTTSRRRVGRSATGLRGAGTVTFVRCDRWVAGWDAAGAGGGAARGVPPISRVVRPRAAGRARALALAAVPGRGARRARRGRRRGSHARSRCPVRRSVTPRRGVCACSRTTTCT